MTYLIQPLILIRFYSVFWQKRWFYIGFISFSWNLASKREPLYPQNVWFSLGKTKESRNLSDVRTGRAFWFGEHDARLQLCCACVALIKLAHAHLGIVDISKSWEQLVWPCLDCECLLLLVWTASACLCLLLRPWHRQTQTERQRHNQTQIDTDNHRQSQTCTDSTCVRPCLYVCVRTSVSVRPCPRVCGCNSVSIRLCLHVCICTSMSIRLCPYVCVSSFCVRTFLSLRLRLVRSFVYV